MLCPNCDKNIEPEPVSILRIFKVRNKGVEFYDRVHRCPKCCSEWSQPGFDFAYEAYKVFRAKCCQTCEQRCPVKYVGNLQGCLGYQQTCLCNVCVDSKCGNRGSDDVKAGCIYYQPDPAITELWHKGRKLIDKVRTFSEGHFEEDD